MASVISVAQITNKRKSNKIRRSRNRAALIPGIIPAIHPLLPCKREGCAACLTLLGNVKSHFEDLKKCRERGAEKLKEYPKTYFHGSCLTCEECGDRPRVGTNGRHASWQRMCSVCGEAYAMNGFWRSHGGYNNQNLISPLHMRSSIHKSNLRREWSTNAIENLDTCLYAEKAWLRLAKKDTNFRLRGEIKDIDEITNKMGRISTSKIENSSSKRHRSASEPVSSLAAASKRGNLLVSTKDRAFSNYVAHVPPSHRSHSEIDMGIAGEALAMLSNASSSMSSSLRSSNMNSLSTSVSPRGLHMSVPMSMVEPSISRHLISQQQQQQRQQQQQQQQIQKRSLEVQHFLPILGSFVQIRHDGVWHRAYVAMVEGLRVSFFLPNLGITISIVLPDPSFEIRADLGYMMTQR